MLNDGFVFLASLPHEIMLSKLFLRNYSFSSIHSSAVFSLQLLIFDLSETELAKALFPNLPELLY
jgi:hypothetical protein